MYVLCVGASVPTSYGWGTRQDQDVQQGASGEAVGAKVSTKREEAATQVPCRGLCCNVVCSGVRNSTPDT